MRIEFDPNALDTPMVCAAHPWTAVPSDRCCVKHRSDSCCGCDSGKLYEKSYGTIVAIIHTHTMTIRLDNGRTIFLDKLWGCGGGKSKRIVIGARVKVYQHDWKLFYRLVGQ